MKVSVMGIPVLALTGCGLVLDPSVDSSAGLEPSPGFEVAGGSEAAGDGVNEGNGQVGTPSQSGDDGGPQQNDDVPFAISNPLPGGCAERLAQNPGSASGVFDLPGGGGFRAYCDQETAGGGWTLVMRIKGNQNTFGYGSRYWTTNETLRANNPGLNNSEAKLPGYNTLGFRDLMLVMSRDQSSRYVVMTPDKAPEVSLLDMMQAASHVPSELGEAAWTGLVDGFEVAQECQREGIMPQASSRVRVRIGLVGSSVGCNAHDSYVGVGATSYDDDGDACRRQVGPPAGNGFVCDDDDDDDEEGARNAAAWTNAFVYVR